ncbi:MAG: hypothetical protein QXO47_10210 [Thermoproteota archaeon]
MGAFRFLKHWNVGKERVGLAYWGTIHSFWAKVDEQCPELSLREKNGFKPL